jgi:hypothetical protein
MSRMRHNGILVVVLLLLVAASVSAQPDGSASPPPADTNSPAGAQAATFEPGEVFINANAAYEGGEHQRAIELYTSLLEHGLDNAHLYYNLGNAYLRGGELGRAIAAYRRSLALSPRDQDLLANLAFARRSAKDALEPPRPPVLVATLLFWHHGLSLSELATVALVVNVLLWAALAVRLVRRDSDILRWIIAGLILVLLASAGSLAVRTAFPTRVAVVVPQEINVFTGPESESLVRFKLHAGSEVTIEDRREGWLRIALPDGKQGWLEDHHAEVVDL